jgi:hypothetical protein
VLGKADQNDPDEPGHHEHNSEVKSNSQKSPAMNTYSFNYDNNHKALPLEPHREVFVGQLTDSYGVPLVHSNNILLENTYKASFLDAMQAFDDSRGTATNKGVSVFGTQDRTNR